MGPQGPAGAGTGNVTNTGASVAGHVPKYSDTTGTQIVDGYAVGTGPNCLVQLDGSSKLPAVDGSQLTHLPAAGIPDAASDGKTYGRLNAAWSQVLPIIGGTLTGSLAIGGPAPDSPLTVNANTVAPAVAVAAGTTVHVVGSDTNSNIFTLDAYGAVNVPAFRGSRARNTAAAPQAVQIGDTLSNIQGQGYDGAGYFTGASIQIIARDNFTPTAHGGSIGFYTLPLGSTVIAEGVRIQPSGGMSVGAAAIAVDPGVGSINISGSLTASGKITVGAGHQ